MDYSKVKGLQYLRVDYTKYDLNIGKVQGLKTLDLWHYGKHGETLRDAFCSEDLDILRIGFSGLRSLEGLSQAKKILEIELEYNRRLEDISELTSVADSLAALSIEKCPKITDFTVLKSLHELETLYLEGSNVLPNLEFLRHLPKLKIFILRMDVADGDLNPCFSVPYVRCKNKKHFSHKNEALPKEHPGNYYVYRKYGIERWRTV